MKKYPRWAFLIAGVIATVSVLYFWGKHNMKKQAKAAGAAPVIEPGASEAKKISLAGPVIRL
jgi:hypothetical protein